MTIWFAFPAHTRESPFTHLKKMSRGMDNGLQRKDAPKPIHHGLLPSNTHRKKQLYRNSERTILGDTLIKNDRVGHAPKEDSHSPEIVFAPAGSPHHLHLGTPGHRKIRHYQASSR